MCQALCYMPDIHGEKNRPSDPALPRGLAEPDGACQRDRPGNPTPGQVSRPLENSVWLPLRSLSLNSFICKMGAAAPPSTHRVALGFYKIMCTECLINRHKPAPGRAHIRRQAGVLGAGTRRRLQLVQFSQLLPRV